MVAKRMQFKAKTYATNILVSIVSLAVGILVLEVLARVFYDPVNFFKPELVQDSILRHKLAPNSGGHDEWGYRNKEVPDSAQYVVIGDSQTYGSSADANDSWPDQLENLVNEEVYNLALGGYGPVQYSYMLDNQALKLKPHSVITGFYLGNDLYDSYYMAYKFDHWAYLRDSVFARKVKDTTTLYDVGVSTEATSFSVKSWLAQHSMVYNIVFIRSFIGDFIRGKRNLEKVDKDMTYTFLNDQKNNIQATFTPGMRLYALNMNDPKIKEGLRISLERLQHMDSVCKSKGIDFTVVIIPTKERVYSAYLDNNSTLRNNNIINELLANERLVTTISKDFFDNQGIKYLEVQQELANGIKDAIYPNDSDGHPNKKGYKIIATCVNNFNRHHQ